MTNDLLASARQIAALSGASAAQQRRAPLLYAGSLNIVELKSQIGA